MSVCLAYKNHPADSAWRLQGGWVSFHLMEKYATQWRTTLTWGPNHQHHNCDAVMLKEIPYERGSSFSHWSTASHTLQQWNRTPTPPPHRSLGAVAKRPTSIVNQGEPRELWSLERNLSVIPSHFYTGKSKPTLIFYCSHLPEKWWINSFWIAP